MNPEIKAAWVAALRSGAYSQGAGRLRDGDNFCCLGVLCDIHAKAFGNEWEAHSENGVKNYLECTTMPPRVVIKWAQMVEVKPTVEISITTDKLVNNHVTLAELNDNGYTFEQIADLIEKQL